MTPQDTMRLALRALEQCGQIDSYRNYQLESDAIKALAIALAQQVAQQEPDTWTDDGGWTFPVERQIIQTR